jgi:hypothetical protein
MKIRRPAPRARGKAPRGRLGQPRPMRHPARPFQSDSDQQSPEQRRSSSG